MRHDKAAGSMTGVLVLGLVLTMRPGPVAASPWTSMLAGAAATATTGGASRDAAGSRGLKPAAQGGEPASGASDSGRDRGIEPDRLRSHLPDLKLDRQRVVEELEQARRKGHDSTVALLTGVLQRVDTILRPTQLHLSLEEALGRALASNYDIETQRYNPAVATTAIVDAEAAFDAIFFSSLAKNKIDRPTASTLFSADVDRLDVSAGVRKLLPSGMQVSATYGLNREKTTLVFQSAALNPAYFSDLALEMRQPFLRGFGLDYNRSIIVLAKNDRTVSNLAFHRQVRDTLRTVEELYWRLVQARRDVVITARLLGDFEGIYDNLWARRDFDITPVQISATKASLEQSRADFVRVRANLFDAEDRLIAALNAPDVHLADNVEIIPGDFPSMQRITVDRLAEVQTALDRRPEVQEQRTRVANAKIGVGRAKNEELPRLDVVFRYTISGLAGTADRSFDEFSRHNFVDYFVGVEFELPIGNRGPRSSHHRARLQHSQSRSAMKSVLEGVILEVNLAVRNLATSYDQIAPSFESAEARQREIESIVARAERQDLNTLNSELAARRSLASARQAMLGVMIDYNIAMIELQRAKGTLLEYNNVVIPTEDK